ncbi:hypothetical protein CRG98_022303 [Punica granatum]|uniref:Uncharacterized protein n=1 Tax=Punica granatum TaxID=22663 RepID=A0A2I0JLY6_PUNGR|nr:hypothetical protein CRG98_022303 [Punica granatum]
MDSGFVPNNNFLRPFYTKMKNQMRRGSGSPIGSPDSESTGDPESKSPIGDPDSSTEVADVLCGCWCPQWRVRGHRLAAPTPSPFDFSL